jgi:hypothetical protein
MLASLSIDVPPILILALCVAMIIVDARMKYYDLRKWSRGEERLHDWARQNGYILLRVKESRLPLSGPFFLRSNIMHCVYKVAVQDVSGEVHHAWLRLGSWLRGIATDDVAIRWIDGEPDPEKIAEHHKPRERFLPGKPVRRAKKKPRGK